VYLSRHRSHRQDPIRESSAADPSKRIPTQNQQTPRVDVIKNTHLEPSCHCTGTTTVVHPNQNVTYVIREPRSPPQESDPTKRARVTFPTKSNPVVCRRNEPGLSVHWTQSGGQPAHLSLLPSTGSEKHVRKRLSKGHWFFFFFLYSFFFYIRLYSPPPAESGVTSGKAPLPERGFCLIYTRNVNKGKILDGFLEVVWFILNTHLSIRWVDPWNYTVRVVCPSLREPRLGQSGGPLICYLSANKKANYYERWSPKRSIWRLPDTTSNCRKRVLFGIYFCIYCDIYCSSFCTRTVQKLKGGFVPHVSSWYKNGTINGTINVEVNSEEDTFSAICCSRPGFCCLLWIDKAKTKDKMYIWVSVLWKNTN